MAEASKLNVSRTVMPKYGVIISRNYWHHSYPQDNYPLGPEWVRNFFDMKLNQKIEKNQDGEKK